jgi:ribokinase
MAKIVVVGSFVVGLTIRVPRMPVLGEGLIGDEFDMGPGGKGTNQAIGASRLSADVSLLACVGDDLLSQVAFDTFEKEGVALDHIHRIEGVNTAVGVVHLIPSGDNWIIGHLGANLEMRPEHVDAAEDLIAESDLVLSQFEVPLPVVQHAMALGRKHGVQTVWNPAPALPVPPEVFQNIDVLTPNETELRILLDVPPDDPTPTVKLAQRLLERGVSRLVVTLGEKGSLIVRPEGATEVPAVARIRAVDVTGAGDSFNAALAVSLAEGKGLSDAVRRASYAGAYAVQHLGVIDGLPTREELVAFEDSRGRQ